MARHAPAFARMKGVKSMKTRISAVAAVLVALSAIFAATHDFAPEYTFQGSALTGWHTLGNAAWRAENGEIVAKPDTPDGGWLVMDKGYQDVEFYTEFHCADKCDAGVLLRAEKTPEGGWKGVYAPISGDTGSFDVVLDASGKELKRTPLARATAQFARYDVGPWTNGQNHVPGFAALAPTVAEEEAAAANPPAPAGAGGGRGAGAGAGGRGAAAGGRGAALGGRGGAGRGDTTPPEWTPVDLIMDGDIFVNRRGGGNSATDDHMMGYGPIALHVGGTSEVRFRDVSLQDLNHKIEPAEQTSTHFKKQSLTDFMYSWGAAAGDINHDGIPDVVAGPYYFVGDRMREDRQMAIEVNHLILPSLKGQFRGDRGSADRKYRQLQLRHGSEFLRVHALGQVEKLAHSHRPSARVLGSAIFHEPSGTRYEIRSPEPGSRQSYSPPAAGRGSEALLAADE